MRITIIAAVAIIAGNLGLAAADMLMDMQDKRMSALCKVQPTYCK